MGDMTPIPPWHHGYLDQCVEDGVDKEKARVQLIASFIENVDIMLGRFPKNYMDILENIEGYDEDEREAAAGFLGIEPYELEDFMRDRLEELRTQDPKKRMADFVHFLIHEGWGDCKAANN